MASHRLPVSSSLAFGVADDLKAAESRCALEAELERRSPWLVTPEGVAVFSEPLGASAESSSPASMASMACSSKSTATSSRSASSYSSDLVVDRCAGSPLSKEVTDFRPLGATDAVRPFPLKRFSWVPTTMRSNAPPRSGHQCSSSAANGILLPTFHVKKRHFNGDSVLGWSVAMANACLLRRRLHLAA